MVSLLVSLGRARRGWGAASSDERSRSRFLDMESPIRSRSLQPAEDDAVDALGLAAPVARPITLPEAAKRADPVLGVEVGAQRPRRDVRLQQAVQGRDDGTVGLRR